MAALPLGLRRLVCETPWLVRTLFGPVEAQARLSPALREVSAMRRLLLPTAKLRGEPVEEVPERAATSFRGGEERET